MASAADAPARRSRRAAASLTPPHLPAPLSRRAPRALSLQVKYAQLVRAAHPDNGGERVLVKIEMDEGHAGAMDRYKYLEQKAYSWTWLLSKMGVAV